MTKSKVRTRVIVNVTRVTLPSAVVELTGSLLGSSLGTVGASAVEVGPTISTVAWLSFTGCSAELEVIVSAISSKDKLFSSCFEVCAFLLLTRRLDVTLSCAQRRAQPQCKVMLRDEKSS